MDLKFEDIIKEKAPELQVALITADIENPATPDALWDELSAESARFHNDYAMERVNKRPAIAATRKAYKAFGKDPNRYRPSAEALTRRAVKGLELYRTTTIVDLINLVSLATGHSIGAFDADKIEGDTLTLGVGREGEPYLAIGRGELNIAGLPVWRDTTGGVGTPTSDNDRTKLSADTKRLVVTVNCYDGEPDVTFTADKIADLLRKYASATNIHISYFKP